MVIPIDEGLAGLKTLKGRLKEAERIVTLEHIMKLEYMVMNATLNMITGRR